MPATAGTPAWQPADARYSHQAYQRCGRWGLKLPAVSLGLWHNFGSLDDEAHSRRLLRHAVDRGITHLDLANNYGPPPGSAEALLGRWLRDEMAAHRDELVISTKAGYVMGPGPCGDGGSRKHLLDSLDASLRRLGLGHVDIFYHHRPDPQTPLDETVGALDFAVRSGRARYVGLSNYPAELAREAATRLRALGTPCLLHQPRYNLLARAPEQGLLQVLVDEGIGCIPFSPLAQGLLSARYLDGRIPADSRAARAQFLRPATITPALLTTLRALDALAGQHGLPLAGLALRWLLQRPAVCSVLIGASQTGQIDAAVAAAAAAPLTDEVLQRIDAVLAATPASP